MHVGLILFPSAYSCVTYVAGAVVCTDNSDVSVGFSNPVLEAIELVDVRLLEPIPQEKGETVSVQGRLCKHASFWLNVLDASHCQQCADTENFSP